APAAARRRADTAGRRARERDPVHAGRLCGRREADGGPPALAEAVGGPLTVPAALRRREQTLVLGAAGAVLATASLLPLSWLGAEAPAAAGAALAVLATPRPWLLLARSLGLSAAVTVCALVIGTPLAVLVARTDLPGRRALWLLHAFPISLPPFLLA